MPTHWATQDPSSSPRSVARSDLSSSPGLQRCFSELRVGSPPDFPSLVSLIETRPVLSTIHINDLPVELVGEIFVKHSELEWYAPAVDGQVCRYWRTTVLSTARAWSRIRIKVERVGGFPSESAWELWIERAMSAPLDVRILIRRGWAFHENALAYMLSALLKKADSIASLEVSGVQRTFFLTPFPLLRHLRIDGWSFKPPDYPHNGQFHVASMPALRSLTLGNISCNPFATSATPPLSELSLSHNTTWNSLVWHSHETLTSLSLHCCGPWVGLEDNPIALPNLIFLSLYDIPLFKPCIISPRLQTLHEAFDSVCDSFPRPLRSLTEYGVLTMAAFGDCPRFHVNSLHSEFPNLVKLSLRATAEDTLSFFKELADYPACFPNLQWIEAENDPDSRSTFSDRETMTMLSCLVRRNQAALSVPLKACFWEPEKKHQIPLLFADVCDYHLWFPEQSLTRISGPGYGVVIPIRGTDPLFSISHCIIPILRSSRLWSEQGVYISVSREAKTQTPNVRGEDTSKESETKPSLVLQTSKSTKVVEVPQLSERGRTSSA